MGETPANDLDRYKEIKKAVIAAKTLKITDISQRREFVIDAKGITRKLKNPWVEMVDVDEFPSVAKPDLRHESPRTINSAINKYFKIYGEQHSSRRVIVEILHSKKPNDGEVSRVNKYLPLEKEKELKQKYEVGTEDIGTTISDALAVPSLVAKKSRIWSDLNRPWYRTTMKGGVKTAEFSRSGKAAQFFAYRRLLRNGGHLDLDEKVKHPILSLSIYGMKDHKTFGFAIAGGVKSASSEIIDWFQKSLSNALAEVGIFDSVKVDKTGEYSGLSELASYRNEPEEIADRQHPSFGNNFHKIQLEIDKRYRLGENKVKVARALQSVLAEFEEKFK